MKRPLALDLFAGLSGWGEGLLAEGYAVIAVDIVDMCAELGQERPKGIQLLIQDVLTLHGSQFKDCALIVASPPCQKYSYMAMPWSKGKALAQWYRKTYGAIKNLNALFDACFRIQREASAAAGRHIPMVVENVRGAQPWVGMSKANYGSFHFWGDVAMVGSRVVAGKLGLTNSGVSSKGRLLKQPGRNFHFPEKYGIPSQSFHGHDAEPSVIAAMARNNDGVKLEAEATKLGGSWFHGYRKGQGPRNHGSKSKARKAASAQIAKIPFPLAQYIAAAYKPEAL